MKEYTIKKHGHHTYRLISLLCAIFIFMTIGCTVPKHMRVRSGIDPRHKDDDVRFRTTYYFRVIDPDRETLDEEKPNKIQKDSLYRFRMTGKANSLTNKVHFESGILDKDEIDPFGAAIVYDEELGRHRYVSQSETKMKAVRNEKYAEIKRMKKLYDELSDKPGKDGKATDKDNDNDLQKSLKTEIVKIISNINTTSKLVDIRDKGKPATSPRGGFEILGPQGWKTFNQDERLILAMTSNGKPLISSMRELSNRILNEKTNPSETLLPLVNEQLKISRAERLLDSAALDQSKDMDKIIGNVLNELENDSLKKGGIR